MKILHWLSGIWSTLMHGRPDEILNHVPVKRTRDYRTKKRIADARKNHGKEFHGQSKIERKLPLSRDLLELNEKSKPVTLIETVYQIKKATK